MDKATEKWIAEIEASPEYHAEGLAMDLTCEFERRREELGLSYADIARAMGVSRQRVHTIFSGTQNSTIGSLVKVAMVLGCNIKLELAQPEAKKPSKAKTRSAAPKAKRKRTAKSAPPERRVS